MSSASFDLDAELAAFAEIERLAEETQVDATVAPTTDSTHSTTHNAVGTAAAAAASSPLASSATSTAAASASAPSSTSSASLSKKRKSTTDGNEASSKKPHIIISSAAATVTPIAAAAIPPPVDSAYADIVAADRAALLARQQAAAGASNHTNDSTTDNAAAAASSTSETYIPGQVYNGWLAGVTPTGEPCWLPATPENISAYAQRAQQAADAEAIAHSAAKKQTKASKDAAAAAATGADAAKKGHLRTAAGKVWNDPTLEDWPENDYRIFAGDLGNDVTDALLTQVFERWPSFVKARVVRDKRSGKTKGFGFASFLDPNECVEALKMVDGKYIGNRPCKLRKSDWTKRETSKEKSWTAKHNQFGNVGTKGDKKLHLY